MLPKTKFISSPEFEAERVILTAKVVAEGFYKDKGFVVVEKVGNLEASEVILPKLDYGKIKDFWKRVIRVPLQIPVKADGELIKQVMGGIPAYADRHSLKKREGYELKFRKVRNLRKSDWEKVEDRFWELVKDWMVAEYDYIKDLEVRVTRYGTVSSYRFLNKDKNQKLVCYLREDADLGQLAEIILTALIFPNKRDLNLSWSQIEGTVDFLLTRSKMASLFPGFKPTMNNLVKVSQKDRRKSETYLKNLGVEYDRRDLEVIDGRVWVRGKLAGKEFSEKEEKLLKLLIKRKGEVVSFDEVADCWWGEGEFVSLWALNKAGQRLRNKLVRLGFNREVLRTIYKKGYCLG